MEIQLFKQTLIKQPEIEINEENINLCKELYKYMCTIVRAVGLAAPQVGINKNMCVLKWTLMSHLAINPKIINTYDEASNKKEGCLSWPGKIIHAKRYHKIEVEWYDVFDEKVLREEFTGLNAQIWQHELDHLNGNEFVISDLDTEIKRNDKCPCGSNLKYKVCHGR